MRDPDLLRHAADQRRKEIMESPEYVSRIHFDFLPDWKEKTDIIEQLAKKHNGLTLGKGAGVGQRDIDFSFTTKKNKEEFEKTLEREFTWANIAGD